MLFDDEDSGWDLGGTATQVVLLPAGTSVKGLVHDTKRGGLVPFTLLPFDEIDPEREEEFDTLPGNVHERAYLTKVGGYPRFIQEDIQSTCPRCKSPLRFAAQLSSDTSTFGDAGRLYVFLCPEEHWAGAVVQCH